MQQRPTAPPARTFGPQGPTLGNLSDAYLQDYQVRQFRSQSTARGRIVHLVAFFGRDARAAALTTHQIRQYQLARRIVTICSSLNRVFFMTPSLLRGRHSLKRQLVRKSPGRS